MKALSALLAALLVCACTTVPTPTTTAAATKPAADAGEAAQRYPAWLEMKPGYAEACVSGGGCIPMTQAELNQLAADVMQRTLQACRRAPAI